MVIVVVVKIKWVTRVAEEAGVVALLDIALKAHDFSRGLRIG